MASKAYLKQMELDDNEKQRRHEAAERKADRINKAVNTGIGTLGSIASGVIKAANEPEWYKRWPVDTDRNLNLPTFFDTSTRLEAITRVTGTPLSNSWKSGNPMIMALEEMPRLGRGYNASYTPNLIDNSINNALSMALAQIGKVNSRSVSQDPDVLAFYILGTAEIAQLLLTLKTNIEIVNHFTPYATSIRDGLLKARGVSNIKAFIDNLAQYKKVYNTYACKFNVEFAIPKGITYYARKAFIATCIFKDNMIKKSQYITFHRLRNMFFKVNNQVSQFTFTTEYDGLYDTPANVRQELDSMFNQILYDQDFKDLVANLRAAVADKDMLQMDTVVSEAITTLDVTEHVRHQFHNIKTLPYIQGIWQSSIPTGTLTALRNLETIFTNSNGIGVTQNVTYNYNSNDITGLADLGDYLVIATTAISGKDEMLDFYKDEVGPDDIIEATRLHPVYHLYWNKGSSSDYVVDSASFTIESEGTEAIFGATILSFETGNHVWQVEGVVNTIMPGCDTFAASSDCLRRIKSAQAFDWIFPIYISCSDVSTDKSNTRNISWTPVVEVANCFPVRAEDMAPIHHLCDQSLYYIDPATFSFQK